MDLVQIVAALAQWADRYNVIERIVLFGSRVRGDNRADSDLDVALWPATYGIDPLDTTWENLNQTEFVELRDLFPFCVHLTIIDSNSKQTTTFLTAGTPQPAMARGEVECIATLTKSDEIKTQQICLPKTKDRKCLEEVSSSAA